MVKAGYTFIACCFTFYSEVWMRVRFMGVRSDPAPPPGTFDSAVQEVRNMLCKMLFILCFRLESHCRRISLTHKQIC